MPCTVLRRHPAALAAVLAGGALAVALGGCAAAGSSPGERRFRDTPAAFTQPEPDPACRLTAQAHLVANGIEQVTIRVDVDHSGKLVLLQFLAPDLTPAARLELKELYEGCAWKPALGPMGEPIDAGHTLVERPH